MPTSEQLRLLCSYVPILVLLLVGTWIVLRSGMSVSGIHPARLLVGNFSKGMGLTVLCLGILLSLQIVLGQPFSWRW